LCACGSELGLKSMWACSIKTSRPFVRLLPTTTYGFELMSQDGQEFSWVTIDGKEVVSAAALVYDGWSIYSLLLDFGGSQLTISDSRHAASRLLASTVPRPPRTPL
jgi:hypothetical protein